jgi:N-acetylglucosaminyldiphosphoundecaprenol N-acetyl-beta-D-mannosaminyltransferase
MDEVATRIEFLKVPLDIVTQEQLPGRILDLLNAAPAADGEGKNIILLSLWDLLRARRNREYRDFVRNAALVIPISKSIVSGARFLTGATPIRYMPFNFIVSLLTILERGDYPVYLLGSDLKTLKRTEKNINETFPDIKVEGRHTRRIRKIELRPLTESIHKINPALLMVNRGVHGGEKWIVRNGPHLNTRLRLWVSDIFEVFSGKRRRPSDKTFDRGLEWWGYCCHNPLKFLRVFLYLYYKILLVCNRLFSKAKAKDKA